MADVITRFKLETTQYDSALRNAAQQLNEYGSRAMAAGREFQKFTKGQAEVAREFGNIAVAAKNPKDKVKELVAAFNEAAKAYNALTKEQQQSDWGKGLAESLQTLKVRISDAKKELYDFGDGVKGSGGLTGALDQLAGKFGMNIQQLAGWGAAIGAAKVALDVAKDAFFSSEATVDEWGRVMDSSKSLYEGFLTAINTGDISGYLSRMDEIVSAARTAYNELDRLGTMRTIQAPQKSAQQTENDRIRQMIQTGHYIAPLDGRKPAPGMKDGQLLTPEQIRTLERQLQNGMKTVVGLVGNEVKQTGKAIDAVYERQAKELGMSLSEFRKGTSSWSEFEKRMNEAKDYQEFEAKRRQAQALASSGHNLTPEQSAILNAANPNQRGAKWATFRVDGDRYNELVQLILQRDQQAAQAYGMQSQAYRAINRAEGITTRSLLGGGSGGGKTGGGGSTTTVAKELSPLQQAQKEISALIEEALTADEDRLEVIRKEIAALNEQLKVYKSIQDYVGGKEPKLNTPVGDRNAFEAEQMRRLNEELGISKNAFTEKNVSSFISDLKNQIQTADLGSELYNNLTKQFADANALANLMQTAIKNGIDITQFNPQDLWSKVFGQNPGDYISPEQIEEIRKKIEEIIGKPIKLDLNSGQVNVENKQDKITQESRADFNKITGSLSTITGALQQIGVEIPEGFSKTLGVLQIISTITMAIQALATVTATTSALKSIPIVGMFLHNGGVVHAANGWAGTVPGNSFSGDNVPAMLNSGEVVLTRAMASNLASQLSSNNAGATGRAMATIESDQIKIVLQNGAQSRGMTLSQYLEL